MIKKTGLTLDPKKREDCGKARPREAVSCQSASGIRWVCINKEGKDARVHKDCPVHV